MRFTSRGHEHFTDKPVSVSSRLGKDKEMTMFDRQRAALMQMREEEAAQIKNEEELKADLFDFSYIMEVDEYGLPLFTPYQMADTVQDMPVSAPSKVKEKVEENAVSKDGSEPEPSGGTA